MTRVIAAVAVGAVLAMILSGLLVLRSWLDAQGQAGPSQQACQFARWENSQLWPHGGGPPLPPGC